MAGYKVIDKIYDEHNPLQATYLLEVRCPFCDEQTRFHVSSQDLFNFNNMRPTTLDAETREMLITGLCRQCQADVFGPEEEEDE